MTNKQQGRGQDTASLPTRKERNQHYLNFLYSGIKTDIYHMKEAETIIHDIINSSTIETE